VELGLDTFTMAAKTEAQDEFDHIFNRAATFNRHPEDLKDKDEQDETDEETKYQQRKIDEIMRVPVLDRSSGGLAYKLPDESFDEGRTTGVKGVIADARSYEEARRSKFAAGKENGRINGTNGARQSSQTFLKDGSGDDDDEEFLERWRATRRAEIYKEGHEIRNRRTSPSVRRYGRLDEVDALGYLDAIEKVGRETIVVVFVYDHECEVSQAIEEALMPLVPSHPAIHFVKVNFEDIEFDNAGVPAILAYRNQGDLFANLTYIIDHIPEDTVFNTQALKDILKKHDVL